MPHSDAFGERKSPGLLSRFFGPRTQRAVTVRRTEVLNLDVTTERAEVVQAAVEQWLRGHGIAVTTTVEPRDAGRSRIHAKLGQEDAAKLDLSSERIQTELQNLLADVLH